MKKDKTDHDKKKSLKPTFIFIVMIIMGYFLYINFFVLPPDPLNTVFDLLQERGYDPNVGLSGNFTPGTIIQRQEDRPEGQNSNIPIPIIFKSGNKCFPNIKYKKTAFSLPESSGNASGALGITWQELDQFLPKLTLKNSMISNYSLKLENLHLLTYAKGDISRNFSDECVKALDDAQEGGEKLEWFSTIIESVVADGLTMEVSWNSNTSAEAHNSVPKTTENLLADIRGFIGNNKENDGIKIETANKNKTVIEIKNTIIIGYRSRPIYVVQE